MTFQTVLVGYLLDAHDHVALCRRVRFVGRWPKCKFGCNLQRRFSQSSLRTQRDPVHLTLCVRGTTVRYAVGRGGYRHGRPASRLPSNQDTVVQVRVALGSGSPLNGVSPNWSQDGERPPPDTPRPLAAEEGEASPPMTCERHSERPAPGSLLAAFASISGAGGRKRPRVSGGDNHGIVDRGRRARARYVIKRHTPARVRCILARRHRTAGIADNFRHSVHWSVTAEGAQRSGAQSTDTTSNSGHTTTSGHASYNHR